jgi:hypothetical protein
MSEGVFGRRLRFYSGLGLITAATLMLQIIETRIKYLARQLHAFKDGTRRNDIYTRMRSVAAKLSDREIDRLQR